MLSMHQISRSKDINLTTKCRLIQAVVSYINIWMWKLDCEINWSKDYWVVVLENALRDTMDSEGYQQRGPGAHQIWREKLPNCGFGHVMQTA